MVFKGGNIEIFDTAGRQEVDVALIEELQQLNRFLQPQETLLVVDAATGQQAVSVATHFKDALEITGIILTKLDGDARGGAALSMREVTQRPIKFVGTGEKLEQFEAFVPERLAGRILGMGDVIGLWKKLRKRLRLRMLPAWRKNSVAPLSISTTSSANSRCFAKWARWKMSLACCPA